MIANWLTTGLVFFSGIGLAWQIRRDVRKDRTEQNRAAIDEALKDAARDAAIAELREEMKGRDRDDDDTD